MLNEFKEFAVRGNAVVAPGLYVRFGMTRVARV